jgi:Meiotically up-regulated gene 113
MISTPCYTLLSPGVVHYVSFDAIAKNDVETAIAEIKQQLTSDSTVKMPEGNYYSPKAKNSSSHLKLDFKEIEILTNGESWENKVRVHYALGRLLVHEQMPSCVYQHFHVWLELGKDFAFQECLESWVKEASENADLAESYETSKEHEVAKCECLRPIDCVFKKTDFVKNRLTKILQRVENETREAGRQVEEELKKLENERTAADLETLRKSRFDVFVYVMEDLRNGAFKIGRSKTPGKRERTLQSEVPQTVLRFSIPADEDHEKQLHAHFDEKNRRGEWFDLAADDLIWIVTFLKENGDVDRAYLDYEWLGEIYFRSGKIKP